MIRRLVAEDGCTITHTRMGIKKAGLSVFSKESLKHENVSVAVCEVALKTARQSGNDRYIQSGSNLAFNWKALNLTLYQENDFYLSFIEAPNIIVRTRKPKISF